MTTRLNDARTVTRPLFTAVLAATLVFGAVPGGAQNSGLYEVTITNLTRGQQFTPVLVATHRVGVGLFEPGQPASAALEMLAEEGNTGPLVSLLGATPGTFDVATSAGLLDPGASVTVQVRGGVANARQFSLAAMMIPTNDGFISVNAADLPVGRQWSTFVSPAWDAGTEPNDETCASIPGPFFEECGGPGTGGSPADGSEGFVHIHAGIHGIGDFSAAARDWRNPVARIDVRRIR